MIIKRSRITFVIRTQSVLRKTTRSQSMEKCLAGVLRKSIPKPLTDALPSSERVTGHLQEEGPLSGAPAFSRLLLSPLPLEQRPVFIEALLCSIDGCPSGGPAPRGEPLKILMPRPHPPRLRFGVSGCGLGIRTFPSGPRGPRGGSPV